ncbi:putative serine/threonine-protein kinase [Hordeum vulgare]|nr:putative serine/threonine-protein kinase [Hordeum vulgare]
MREALYMLGLNPNQHGLVNAAVAAASIGSSAFPQMVLPDSPRASACTPMADFYIYPQTSRLSGECSLEVSVVAPFTPIDLNATPVADDSSSGGASKRARQMPAEVLPYARNLFDDYAPFMRDQVGMHLDGFPLDHEFPQDYVQEEEDESDIEGKPLFDDELANQAA